MLDKSDWRRRTAVVLVGALALGIVATPALSAQGAGSGEPMPGMDVGGTPTPGMNMALTPMPGMQTSPASPTAGTGSSSMPTTVSSVVTEMNGLIMPPGMIMSPGMTLEQMKDMAAVDTTQASHTAPADARGNQPLHPTIVDGVKTFDLEASIIQWNILPDVQVGAYAYNHQIPGPLIRITEGEPVRINVTNNLAEPTSVHWHGLIMANNMDGDAPITQQPIPPGGTYTYEFTPQQHGTYWYHSHDDPDRQQALGLYGALIIDPKDPTTEPAADQDVIIELQEWTVRQGYTFPSMPMEGVLPNYFTINGKSYPSTDTINAKVGQKIRIRFIGTSSAFAHPMHIHGGPFAIVATDGNPVASIAQILKDTVNVSPGERYDVIWTAREPGKWLLHCHINHHATNDNREQQGGGGLMMIINITQ